MMKVDWWTPDFLFQFLLNWVNFFQKLHFFFDFYFFYLPTSIFCLWDSKKIKTSTRLPFQEFVGLLMFLYDFNDMCQFSNKKIVFVWLKHDLPELNKWFIFNEEKNNGEWSAIDHGIKPSNTFSRREHTNRLEQRLE